MGAIQFAQFSDRDLKVGEIPSGVIVIRVE